MPFDFRSSWQCFKLSLFGRDLGSKNVASYFGQKTACEKVLWVSDAFECVHLFYAICLFVLIHVVAEVFAQPDCFRRCFVLEEERMLSVWIRAKSIWRVIQLRRQKPPNVVVFFEFGAFIINDGRSTRNSSAPKSTKNSNQRAPNSFKGGSFLCVLFVN